jgi:hypothetical protein
VRSLRALSISQPLHRRLQARPFSGQVLASFEQACDLITADGEVVALVVSSTGDGPLNVVVDAARGDFDKLKPGNPARVQGTSLRVGHMAVELSGAVAWDPRPAWDSLRACDQAGVERLSELRRLALDLSPPAEYRFLCGGSLAMLLRDDLTMPVAEDSAAKALATRAFAAAKMLRLGWEGSLPQLQTGASLLAGLGGGLTPAGDDLLCGLMLWAWLAHPAPGPFCEALLTSAEPRTTTLSAAFLRAAARGECTAKWHGLLQALCSTEGMPLEPRALGVLRVGATSGADTLAGFLWMGTAEPAETLRCPSLDCPQAG